MRYRHLAAALMVSTFLTAGIASAQTYGGTSGGTSGSVNTTDATSDGTVLGTTTDPGVPNTGAGGNAAANLALLTVSGLTTLLGIYALKRFTL
jgi:hypothetical protein